MLNLGFKPEIPMGFILSYLVNYVLRKRKFTKSIFAWHRRTLRNYILGHIKDDTLKEDTHLKELIHPEFKLALTTGFIASGNSY